VFRFTSVGSVLICDVGPELAPASRVSTFSPLPLGGEGPGGEGVNALKPQTTQRCPQVSREGPGRRVVVAQCFQRRDVNCKRTGAGPPPPHPAPSADGLKRTPAAVHPLPQGGEGKSRKARKSQQKCRNSRGRGLPRPGRPVPPWRERRRPYILIGTLPICARSLT
jgi:hypothetical protein